MPLFHRRTGRAERRNPTNGELEVRSRSVTLASATLVNRKQIRRGIRKMSWQEEAWAFYDTIGELHAATKWLGNAMSRSRLFIGQANAEGGEPSPADHPPEVAVAALDELFGGSVGQAEFMRRISTNLDVVGEMFLVRLPKTLDPTADSNSNAYRWIVASTDEFSFSRGQSRLLLPEDGSTVILDPDQVTVIRLWSPHPRQAWEPDSAVRSNLPVLREIQALSQHITATVESRLAGAGLLAIPKSATLPNPNIQEGGNPLHHNAFVDALVQGMVTPITDRDNASAVVPLVISVDDDSIGKIQYLTFSTELSNQVTQMRQAALERFATGTDLPQEVILGLGRSSHWNAAEIEEQAIKVAVEPTASAVCDALTQQFLWPVLRGMRVPNPEQWCVWYSTADLAQRPDRSAQAQALYELGVLSPDALLRENGFSDEDLPDPDEQRQQFARQVVLANPPLIEVLAPFVGFGGMEEKFKDVLSAKPAAGAAPGQKPQGQNPFGNDQPQGGLDPSMPTRQSQSEIGPGPNKIQRYQAPEVVTASATRLDTVDGWRLAAIELVVLRALELAGKKMLTGGPRGLRGTAVAKQVRPYDLHTITQPPANLDRLLDGAFDLSHVALGDQPCLQQAIEAYVRGLLASRRPHRQEYLITALQHAECTENPAA